MEEHKMSRRQVVTGLGTTLAAVAVSPVFGGTMIEKDTIDGAVKISDPITLHPKPPFKSQPQPWPGLQSKMDPVPNCE